MSDSPARPSTKDEYQERLRSERRFARIAAAAFTAAILAAFGLFAVYIQGGDTQVEGLLLFVAFSGIGVGLSVWVRGILREPRVVEDRYPLRSEAADRAAFEELYLSTLGEAKHGGRRRFLLRLLMGAGLAVGAALLVPLRSLGPGPAGDLFRTSWRPGSRLVDDEGNPLRPEDIAVDQIVTVFPSNAVGAADSQAVLIGARDGLLVYDALLPTVENLVAYSKLCTHAGCPVGLYRAKVGELLCPCHQSTFDAFRGAVVLSGPAGRPLPQLPIGVDDEGFLVALSDFEEPVGPTFWNYTDGGSEQA